MKARIIRSMLDVGSTARDFIRLVKNASSRAVKGMDESHGREARDILESVRDQENSGYELDIDITGKNLIGQMDRDFENMGLVPYHFSNAASAAGEGIGVGSHVSIPGDERRFKTISIYRRDGSVRIRDAEGNECLIPWQLARPWRE